MKTQYVVISKGKWSARPQMGIEHGLTNKDMNHEDEVKFSMKEVSKMIEEAVSKAMESKGLRLENNKVLGNGNGNGQVKGC